MVNASGSKLVLNHLIAFAQARLRSMLMSSPIVKDTLRKYEQVKHIHANKSPLDVLLGQWDMTLHYITLHYIIWKDITLHLQWLDKLKRIKQKTPIQENRWKRNSEMALSNGSEKNWINLKWKMRKTPTDSFVFGMYYKISKFLSLSSLSLEWKRLFFRRAFRSW